MREEKETDREKRGEKERDNTCKYRERDRERSSDKRVIEIERGVVTRE